MLYAQKVVKEKKSMHVAYHELVQEESYRLLNGYTFEQRPILLSQVKLTKGPVNEVSY